MNRPRLTWLISLLDPATRAAFLAKCESEGPQSVTAGNEDVADAEWLRDALRPYALADEQSELLEACKEWLEIDGPTVSLAEQRKRWVGVRDRMTAAVAKAEGR